MYDPKKETVIKSDASSHGIGVTLFRVMALSDFKKGGVI